MGGIAARNPVRPCPPFAFLGRVGDAPRRTYPGTARPRLRPPAAFVGQGRRYLFATLVSCGFRRPRGRVILISDFSGFHVAARELAAEMR